MKVKPSLAAWIEVATIAANENGISLHRVVGDCRRRSSTAARWSAWRALLDKNPNYSISGVAKVSGFDHSSVINAMQRMAQSRVRIGGNIPRPWTLP